MTNSTLSPTVHPIRTKIGGVFMHVSNMERSAEWYHRLFGLPDRSSVTDKVHSIEMDNKSNLVLDQHGYDRGLAIGDRPLLMLDSPDVHAAYRFVKEQGVKLEWDIEEYPGMAFFTLRDPDDNLLMVCGKPGNKGIELEDESSTRHQSASDPVRYDGGGTFLNVTNTTILAEVHDEGLSLTGRAYTELSYSTPLRIETTVRMEGGCLRLRFGEYGQLTFNYGPSTDKGAGSEFYVIPPNVNKTFSYSDKGGIPVGEWVRVDWTLHERYMEVRVNDQLFYRQEGYYADVVGRAGIGADNGQVTVRSYVVEPLTSVDCLPTLQVTSNGVRNGDSLVPDSACYPAATAEGLWLATTALWGSARTSHKYEVPFACTMKVRADTNSLILYGDSSLRVKFHPDGKLSFQDAANKQESWSDGKEGILPTQEAEIVWKVESDRIQVLVEGEVRFEQEGRFAGRRYGIGVGPDQGSAVVIRTLDISSL